MQMIKGITVTLYQRTQSGTDAFNQPIYTETPVEVDDVLVAPSTNDDVITSTDLVGKKAIYTLGIPKGDTHSWEGNKVSFFGEYWKVFTFEIRGIEENVPTRWHKKVMVERYE